MGLHDIDPSQSDNKVINVQTLKSILCNSPNLISIFDLQGRYLAVGSSLQRILEKDEKDIVGKKFEDVLPERLANALNQRLLDLELKGEPVVTEATIQYKNSDITLSTTYFPLNDTTGEKFAYCAISVDVTERRQAEEKLLEIVENIPSGAHIYEIDNDGNLVFAGANRTAFEILGIDHRQLIGKTIEQAFPGIDQTEIPSVYKRVAAEGNKYHAQQIEFQYGEIDGTYEIHGVQLAQNRMVAFFSDITELAQAYDATIEGWSRAMDMRDKETEGHSQRVTEMTLQLARDLGISESQLNFVRWGALLHDMGKLGVPDSILHKPGELTDDEWAIMRRHPEIAYEMLSPIHFLQQSLDIPYCHHEKWDGTGYPQGLSGEKIPLIARIFSIADVYDALCSDRPYRPAWSKKRACEYIKSESGTHFDPRVVKAFMKLIECKQ